MDYKIEFDEKRNLYTGKVEKLGVSISSSDVNWVRSQIDRLIMEYKLIK